MRNGSIVMTIAWHEERQHRHDEDAEAEARGALDETRADAQQKYGENNATHLYYQVFHWVTTPLVIIHVLEADRGV